MTKIKVLKLSEFIEEFKVKAFKEAKASNTETSLTPKLLQHLYEERYPNLEKKDSSSYRKALIRCGMTADKRTEFVKEQRQALAQADIFEYKQVKDYLANSEGSDLQKTISTQLTNLRKIWEIMGKTDPNTWSQADLYLKIEESGIYKKVITNGVKQWEYPAAVKVLLSPISTMFQGVMQKNWSANLCVHKAGELRDFMRFQELEEFLSNVIDTPAMSKEGLTAMFSIHINMGCREGANSNTGIIGLLWEDIDFAAKRCSLREKGHRGNAGERWNLTPLNLFPFLHGWDRLMKWHEQQGKPTQGKVFPINYSLYNAEFHAVCKRCQSRLKDVDSNDCLRLHIFRRTHGQYCKRYGIPLELICGDAPNGRFGVGWKDPKIPVRYYLSEESEEIDEEELKFMQDHAEYHKVLKSMQEQNQKIKDLLGGFA